MDGGILGAIANPQMADVAGALNYRQAVMDKDEAKRKELRMNQLISEAIPNMKDGSPIKEMFQTDPQKAAMVSKVMGIPLNDGEAWEKLRSNVRDLSSLANSDPRMAIDRAKQMQAENQRLGIQDPQMDKWLAPIDQALNDPDPNNAQQNSNTIQTQFNALHVMDQNLNSDYHAKVAADKTKASLDERGMQVKEREAAAQEQKAKGMTPFEQAQVAHWNTADTSKANNGGLSSDAIELATDRLLNGEKAKDVLANFGRGAQGAAAITAVQNRLAEKAKANGVDASSILNNVQNVTADNRTFTELGAREGKIAPAVQEAQNFAKIALDASANVPRDQFVPWNKLKNYSESQLSDPNLAQFKAANTSLINAYARAVGGGSVTVHGQEEGEKMLNTATDQKSYQAVVNQILKETQGALESPKQVRDRMHSDKTSSQQPAATQTSLGGNGWGIRPVGGQ
jgi:hypothetical protein